MAAPPPPYSPREAVRAQRYYWRSMHRPSVVGPLALIAFGVGALLVETGQLSAYQVWEWYVRWWPVLLIVIGIISLAEWWFDRGKPMIGRRSLGGVVALVLLLAIIGYTNRGLRGLDMFDHSDDDFVLRFLGHEHEAERSLNQLIPARAMVDIQVPRGDVTVTPSGDNQVHVQAHEVVYAGNDREAQRSFAALQPRLSVNGANVTLRAAAQDSRADLIIEIPGDATASINAGRGDVTVEGLATPLNVTANHGDVKLNNIHAAARARINKGDFTAHAIAGDLSLNGHLDDVAVTDIDGKVLLEGDFFGDTHLARVSSTVHFQSSRTDIELAKLPGDVSLDSGDLQVDDAAGPARIATTAKDVLCTQVTGNVSVEDADGEISLSVPAPTGEMRIHNRNGAIHLMVPSNANFQLNATARTGLIQSDFALPVNSIGPGHSVSGRVGSGGPAIELVADHGDIRIEKGSSLAAPSIAPGDKPIRHLRAPVGSTEQPSVL